MHPLPKGFTGDVLDKKHNRLAGVLQEGSFCYFGFRDFKGPKFGETSNQVFKAQTRSRLPSPANLYLGTLTACGYIFSL